MLAACLGCSKTSLRDGFAEAHGTITLDGNPLENAQVIFEAEKGTSYGRTDKQGRYQMEYSRSLHGAAVGKTRVSISTKVVFPDEDSSSFKYNPKTEEFEKEELLPAKYNRASELYLDITPGGAPYNFELSSK